MKNISTKTIVFPVILMILLLPLFSLRGYADSKAAEKKININTASLEELQMLPRIGPKVAQRIIDFRKEHGRFKKTEDIMKVKGIGEKTFEKFKDLITVGDEAKKSK